MIETPRATQLKTLDFVSSNLVYLVNPLRSFSITLIVRWNQAPTQTVVKAINGLMTIEEGLIKELEEMERWKLEIDDKARKIVRRELWGGLGYLVVQTAAFMRLTFWELSWDVMEPICFYVTSMYFMIGFAYFIRTSKEPSFEAVFQHRFHLKQMKLMKMEGFDVAKYNELMKACGSHER